MPSSLAWVTPASSSSTGAQRAAGGECTEQPLQVLVRPVRTCRTCQPCRRCAWVTHKCSAYVSAQRTAGGECTEQAGAHLPDLSALPPERLPSPPCSSSCRIAAFSSFRHSCRCCVLGGSRPACSSCRLICTAWAKGMSVAAWAPAATWQPFPERSKAEERSHKRVGLSL